MHPSKVTVLCGFLSGSAICPYFFETDDDERYRSMINNFFWPELNDMDVDNMSFQEDGATCHTASDTMDILYERFLGEYSGFVRAGPKGYLLPKRYEEEAAGFYNMKIRRDDVFVVTFPRSGTTMTQELVWLISNDLDYEKAAKIHIDDRYPFLDYSIIWHRNLAKKLEEENEDPDEKRLIRDSAESKINWIEDLPSPRFIKSHLPLSLLPPNLLDAKVVFVARDPRDVAVSFYHHNRAVRCHGYEGDFKTYWNMFIQNLVMYTPIHEFHKEGWNLRNHPNMLFLIYEDLRKDLRGTIKKIAKFLKKELSGEQIKELYAHLQIEKFRKNVSVNESTFINSGIFKSGEERFIRQGKVGGWRNYFDEEMTKQADQWMKENLSDTNMTYPTFE